MSKAYKTYIRHIYAQSGYRPVWEPSRRLALGQVGVLNKNGVFDVFTSLERNGIQFESNVNRKAGNRDFSSTESVKIDVKASGSTSSIYSMLGDMDAGFKVGLKSDEAVIFKSTGCIFAEITNMDVIAPKIIDLYRRKVWPEDYLIVAHLMTAEAASIIISESSNSEIEFKVNAQLDAPVLSITNPELKLTSVYEEGRTIQYVALENCTPLYRLMGIKNPFLIFGKSKIRQRAVISTAGEEQYNLQFQEFDNRELL